MVKAIEWTFAVLAAMLLLTLAALGAAHLFLSTDQGARWFLGVINTLYPGEVQGSAVEVSLLPQEVVVKDAVLLGPDGRKVLSSERVFLKMDLSALLGLDLVFEAIDALRPDFVMEIDEDGWINIEAAFVEKTPGESPINVYIRKLTCSDGTFTYRTREGVNVVRLSSLDLSMDCAFEHDTLMHFSTPRAAIEIFVSGRRIDLGVGSASCTIFNDQVRDIRASTTRGTTRATLSGSITDMAQKAQFDLDLAINGEMADLRGVFGLGDMTTGSVQGHITARRDYDDPDFTCDLAYGGGTLEGLKIGRSELKGSVRGRVATIERLTGSFASGTFDMAGTVDMREVFPDGFFEGIKEEDAVAYDLSIVGTSLLLDDVPGMPKWVTGRVSPRIALKGSGISADSLRIVASFVARGTGVSAGSALKSEDLLTRGKMTYGRDILGLERLDIRTSTASAGFSGRIDLVRHGVDGTMTLKAPQVRPLLARAGIQGTGSLEATLRMSGVWDRPVVDIEARSSDAVLEGLNLGSIDLKALLDGTGTLNIRSCTVSNRASLVTAQGNVRMFRRFPDLEPDPALNLTIDLAGVDMGAFAETIPVRGTLDGSIRAAGTLYDLTADIRMDGNDLVTDHVHIDRASLDGSLSQGVLTVSRLEATNKGSTLAAVGEVTIIDQRHGRLMEDPPLRLTITGENLLIEDYTDLARGVASVNAALQGTFRRPSGTARILATGIDLGFQRFTSLDIQAASDGDIIWIEPAVLTIAEGENINAKGSLTLGGAYEFSLGTPGISMEHLDLVRKHNSTRGKVFISASGHGLLSNPSLAGRIAAADIIFRDTPLDDMSFSFELDDHKLTADGSWNFRINLQHDLSTGDTTAQALFAETELAPFFTLAGRKNFTGRLTGRMDMQGNVRALKDMVITADISSLDIFHEGMDVVLAHDVNASYRKGFVNLPLTRITFARSGLIDIQAHGEVNRTLTLDADGAIPLEVLGMFMEDLSDGSGTIRVSSQVRARDFRPDVSALITLEDLAWTIPANGQRLHGVNGRIALKNNRLSTEGITGSLDSGAFQIGGTATLEGFVPRNLELLAQTKALPVSIPDMMDMTIDAEASLEVNGPASRFWSDAVVLDGTYYRDVNVNLFTGVLERIITRQQRVKPREVAVRMPWPFLDSTVLDVSIKRRGDVKVDNNIALLDINPDLKITGTLSNPVVNGRIAVTDGIVTFQNNEFTVTKGVIDFLDPSRTRANVDIKAKTQVRDWDITLALEGELDNLQLALSSVPDEEPADILSLLIVGKTSRELTQAQSSVAVSPSGMMAELLASTYGGEIKKATTLDILELRASDFATSTGGESMTLTVGKELSRRMTVKYEMETRNTETVQKAIAEYKILENLLINGYQSTDGTFGTNMLYRYEFR